MPTQKTHAFLTYPALNCPLRDNANCFVASFFLNHIILACFVSHRILYRSDSAEIKDTTAGLGKVGICGPRTLTEI